MIYSEVVNIRIIIKINWTLIKIISYYTKFIFIINLIMKKKLRLENLKLNTDNDNDNKLL